MRSLSVHSWFDFVNYASFNQTGFDQPAFNQPGDDSAQASLFNVVSVLHAGINNLLKQNQHTIAQTVAQLAAELVQTQAHPALPQANLAELAPLIPSLLQRLAATGYANCAQLMPKRLPLQAWLPRQPHVPAGFTLPARVVGPHGETTPSNDRNLCRRQ